MLNGLYKFITGSTTQQQNQQQPVQGTDQDDWVLVSQDDRQKQLDTSGVERYSPVMIADVQIESVESSDAESEMDTDDCHATTGDLTPPTSLRMVPAARIGGARQAPVQARRHTRAMVQKIMESDVKPILPGKRTAKTEPGTSALKRHNQVVSAKGPGKRSSKSHAKVNANRNNDRKNQYY